ncbi:MAG: N-acetyltransferase [Micavibrio aeruginosavorus]|uniref:N-acetyltransferase n=1 Tax=Micavibrio aeruginosavorus TaxID=349221 RepID=A0A2W5MW18_9BACT|nr:MAG: N-acetyltransferase [Micavibrio aeruginosavorus]
MSDSYKIRDAVQDDAPLILSFIRELADYEKLLHEVSASEQDIRATLFGASSKAFALIAECEGRPAGFALCFYNYSTFQGKPGIYLEDLYVRPEFRGRGLGKGFFAHLAKRALLENCGRIQWWVLDWNKPSIEFYKSMKAVPMDEWTVYRLEGQSIEDLAKKAV